MKLHLGCGERYLDGYMNIDFPPTDHTVQSKSVADRHCDVVSLKFALGSIAEVRLHHLFEHFSRAQALALLCNWTNWIEVGGKIHIETPDWDASLLSYLSPFTSEDEREQILRHLFGSHEASWAVHWDAWHQKRFKKVLEALGYTDLTFIKSKWGATKNIEVIATRGPDQFDKERYRAVVERILIGSLIKPAVKKREIELNSIPSSELQMLRIWMEEWDRFFLG